ncbi:hypothetical protein LU276_05155 [Moraxella haemolytica]|uniref:hypothetical protein n=1 Tax=Moraxella TaxID=475 RepID=UPI0025432B2D|nr:hypothetical protein [Moraxella sp. ZY171148]WII94436.1 hypothetical protein LU276_05155 [Moraxella sp. ZY171148]
MLKKLATEPIKRPTTPIVPMQLSDDEATRRLVAHATQRVIKAHKEELQKLAYR